ncbi:restriction endonuclease subunit S [Kitasatospora aureofaciens]|uniref:restriction endonuclease subunit S n=1 Tax=Kitasatospora aureofaciens TaxID=1894 RepID=UPI00339DFD9B
MSERLPTGWTVAPLGDLARIYSGGTPSRGVPAYWGGGIPWVTTAEIDAGFVASAREKITEAGLKASAARIAPPGTLLLAMYGQGKTRGKVALLQIPAAMNQACAAIEVGKKLDGRYLLFYLASRYEEIRSMSNAGSQENLSGDLVRRIPIAYPSIHVQREIAALLGDADDLTVKLEQLIAKKEAIKQGVMQQLLTGEHRLAGWDHSRLSDLIDGLEAGVSVRSSELTSNGVAVLKTSAVSNGRFDPTEAKPVLSMDIGRVRCNPVAGSLIISRMNTPALVGEVAYVERNYENLYLPDRLWLARARRSGHMRVNMRWLGYYLSSGPGSRAVRDLATGTSGSMKNIPKERLLALTIPTPPSCEQDRIAEVVCDVEHEIDLLCRQLSKARDVKQGMTQRLIGRTRLSLKESVA